MDYMFSGYSSLTKLNLTSFNTSNVIDMSYMFRYSLTDENVKVILNYSDETSDFVDGMIGTKVIKGTKYNKKRIYAQKIVYYVINKKSV